MSNSQSNQRLSPRQRELLHGLPRLGEEWEDVSLLSPQTTQALLRLSERGLVDIWYAPERHARLTLEGDRIVRQREGEVSRLDRAPVA